MFAPHNDVGQVSAWVLHQNFSWFPIYYTYFTLRTTIKGLALMIVVMVKTVKAAVIFVVNFPGWLVQTLKWFARTLRLWSHMYFLAILWTSWFVLKDFSGTVATLFCQMFLKTHRKSNPPACLTDGRYGRHCYMKLKNVKLHYVEAGDDSLPLLICLHSFPEFWFSYRYQLSQLSHMYWVVAFDLRGFGDSELSSPDSISSIEEAAEDVIRFLELAGRDHCLVVGHGLGGLVGWHLLYSCPGVITKFVSLSCPHPAVLHSMIRANDPEQRHWTKYIYGSIMPWLPQRLVLNHNVMIVDYLLRKKCYNTTFIGEDDIETYRYVFSRKEDWQGGLKYLKSFAFSDSFLPEEYKEDIQTAVLMLVGEKDDLFSKLLYHKTLEFHDNVIMKTVRGASHWLQQEKPKQVNSLIVEFLEEKKMKQKPVAVGNSLMKRMLGERVSAGISLVSSTVFKVAALGSGLTEESK